MGLGQVAHRRHGVRYPHDFHDEGDGLDETVIDRQYPAAREKFEHLARKFRQTLEQPGPFLYVARATPTRDDAIRLRRLLQGAHPAHRFELLFLGWEEAVQPPDLEGVAHWSWVTLESDKASGREWEGNDAAWDKALRPWPLMAHAGDRIRRRHEQDLEMA